MYITPTEAAAARPSQWPLSFHGIGFCINRSPDGTYEIFAQAGYYADGFATPQAALEAVRDWIEHFTQGGQ